MKKRLYLLAPVLVAALVIVVTGMAGRRLAVSAPPSIPEKLLYCGTCHSMEKETETWQKSPHTNVACLQCHEESDVAWVKHELDDLGNVMADKSQAKGLHAIPLKAPDARCKECHASQMDQVMKDITPAPLAAGAKSSGTPGKAMPIKAAHAVHIDKAGLSCADCHTNSAHGAVLTGNALRDQAHQECMTCHVEKQVKIAVTGSTSCGACHADVAQVTPTDHKNQAVWQKAHGNATATQSCGECHLAESAGPHKPISTPASFPSASKDACASCHNGVQMPHPDGFLATHGKVSLASKTGTCESCHTADSKASSGKDGTAASCTSCHAQAMPHPAGFLANHGTAANASPSSCVSCHSPANQVNPGAAHASAGYCFDCHLQPMPHPDAFLSAHGKEAKKSPATCDACHSAKNVARPTAKHASAAYCSTCHDSYEHPAGWVAGHGSAVTESCSTCHTLQGQPGQHNACSTCHTADGQWHEKMWFVKHGRIVNEEGDATCLTCHNEVKPSCSQCHRDR